VKRLLAIIPVVALVAAACSSSGAPQGVASLDDSAATSTTVAQDPQVSSEDAILAFTQCLRDQGLDVADPTFDGQGGFGFGGQAGGGDVDQEAFQAARDACQQYLADLQQTFDRPDLSQTQDDLIAFSQCMRDQGIAEFPDPDLSAFGPGTGGGPPQGQGGSYGPFGDVDFSDPTVQAAAEACQGQFGGQGGFFGGGGPGGLGGDGTPPTTGGA